MQRGEQLALDRFSLRIERGEHVAILGPNGSGKSTLIKTINRELYPLLRPESSLRILGQTRWDVASLRSQLGIVTNDLMGDLLAGRVGRATGLDIVLSGFFSSLGVQAHQRPSAAMIERAEEALDQLDAPHLAGRRLRDLSSGEGRRLLIARALVHRPHTLLLDEPTTSLDLTAMAELRRALRRLAQSGVALLLVTHHLDDIVPEIERVVLLRQGRVAADGSKPTLLTPARLSELFGVPVTVAERDGYFHAW